MKIPTFWLLSSSALFAEGALMLPVDESVFRLDLRPSVEAVA